MSRLVALSDTHGHQMQIPDGKYLIHCGDYQKGRMEYEDAKAEGRRHLRWLGGQPHQFKAQQVGNHDDWFWFQPLEFMQACYDFGVQPLCTLPPQEGYIRMELGDLIFLGSQHGYPHAKQKTVIDCILPDPRQYDVLVTHGPPFGIFDFEPRKMENCGSRFLRGELEAKGKPGLHLFGHIHDQYGRTGRFANVAICDNRDCKPVNEPMIIDVSALEKK